MIQLEPLAQVCALLGTALAVQLIFQQPATPIESETVAGEGLEKFFKPIALRFPQTVSVRPAQPPFDFTSSTDL